MKQFIDKLISRLEEEINISDKRYNEYLDDSNLPCVFDMSDIMQDKVETLRDVLSIVNQLAEEYKGGWISVKDRLPEDGDNRFYECIVENHEEDVPMFCQYEEEYGFGYWQDLYDEHTLGFVDSEFSTNEELGYEKVIAWKQIEPYQKEGK